MKIIRDPVKIQNLLSKFSNKKKIGFVPTMGALHEGHLSLIRKARKENDIVVVSIFVNPLQFGPKEDFKKYPRPIKKDLYLCKKENVDFVFYPDVKSYYKKDHLTFVEVEKLSSILCGRYRKGHFKGVTTVVTKLFNTVKPDVAYFGQKDLQQAIIIKKMVEDLNFPIKIKISPIVRDSDGLALSSRNVYLNPEERKRALSLYRSLKEGFNLWSKGEKNAKKIQRCILNVLYEGIDTKKDSIDYVEIIDTESLEKKEIIDKKSAAVIAVRIGSTRLIDNIIFDKDSNGLYNSND